ncbi:MAG TPA: valine--tRNA ligase [Chitinophagales bacterium]|nr:valine--tRNA ligase [Chitinophagales bacterium]
MELSKTFDPAGLDDRWYQRWMEQRLFESTPDNREPYTIVIPPPNVTGVLHMGHALNNTIQDICIRRARMMGKNACWVPGTDHASISTEAKVVAMLREKGIEKRALSREEFLQYAWEWRDKYGGIILKQIKKLGCSCDWNRTTFTMDDDYYRSVIRVFIDLYNKGYIYRGNKMINWDPKAKTSLSDEEVIKKEVKSKLYFLRYKLESLQGAVGNAQSEQTFITIATVRPETILGDTAICVHPEDERYKNLVGQFAFVPLINRRIPIIADEYVEQEFGTGALKVTPAHDMNDYNLGLKHHLEVIDTLNEDGTMSAAAKLYVGQDRFECRKNIVKDLEAQGHLVKVEDYTNQIGFSERTDAVIEPRISMQWWCNMKEMAKPALEAVMNDDIKFYPAKFKTTYRLWMENIRDWCISRQLWWGHRIPAWYTTDGRFAVAETAEEALLILNQENGTRSQEPGPSIHHALLTIHDLRQDEDVLDTWFSSWLWPFEVFKGLSNPGNEDVKYYYPTQTLVTAPEIIFFWVARMIMSGFEYEKQKPFEQVYFTGIVRDKMGRKMSKSLGNSPDLLGMIEKYGADAVRFGILISSPAGNDILFDEKLVEQGRNFNNKIWNVLRLVKGWEIAEDLAKNQKSGSGHQFAIEWFENKLNASTQEINRLFQQFDISPALKEVYSLIWDDFCSWYLEMIKPEFGQPVDDYSYNKTIEFLEQLMKLLHPFMPFITEEIFQQISKRGEGEFIMISQYAEVPGPDTVLISEGEKVKEIVSAIRDIRNRNGLKQKDKLALYTSKGIELGDGMKKIISKLAMLSMIEEREGDVEQSFSFLCGADKFFLESPKALNTQEEKSRLEKDLQYQRGFLESVMKKLGNEKFVSKASPEVIANERKKAEDAQEKIRLMEERIQAIAG